MWQVKFTLISKFKSLLSFILSYTLSTSSFALDVNIIEDIASIQVPHNGKMITVQRNQNNQAKIIGGFAKTSRHCPLFCTQPISAAEGVKTIGERELIFFMLNRLKDKSGLLIDARTKDWFIKGTIPGSMNVPYTFLNRKYGADEFAIEEALLSFGASKDEETEQWDFFDAKTLVLWCNGPWCGQSPSAIRGLIELGYPAEKLLYYRGGMQLWQVFGFNIIK